VNQDEIESIKRLLDTMAAATDATDAPREGVAGRSESMDELEDRVDEFVQRMHQLRERIGSSSDPTDQLDALMSRLETRVRRLDRATKRLLGEKIGPQNDQEDD
jgi:chromosome segregation ATPase